MDFVEVVGFGVELLLRGFVGATGGDAHENLFTFGRGKFEIGSGVAARNGARAGVHKIIATDARAFELRAVLAEDAEAFKGFGKFGDEAAAIAASASAHGVVAGDFNFTFARAKVNEHGAAFGFRKRKTIKAGAFAGGQFGADAAVGEKHGVISRRGFFGGLVVRRSVGAVGRHIPITDDGHDGQARHGRGKSEHGAARIDVGINDAVIARGFGQVFVDGAENNIVMRQRGAGIGETGVGLFTGRRRIAEQRGVVEGGGADEGVGVFDGSFLGEGIFRERAEQDRNGEVLEWKMASHAGILDRDGSASKY